MRGSVRGEVLGERGDRGADVGGARERAELGRARERRRDRIDCCYA